MADDNNYTAGGDPSTRFSQKAQFLGINNQVNISDYIQKRVAEKREYKRREQEREREDN